MSNELLYIILFIVGSHICVSIFCVYIGIQIGRSIHSNNSTTIFRKNPKDFHNHDLQAINPIQIDEKKLVIDIDTNNLTKKFDTLAPKKETTDNISGSINKLKNMKG